MIFNLEWLKDFLDTSKDAKEISEKLSEIGLEVENKIPSESLFDKIVVAEILECSNHPDSDHLHVCKVGDGKNVYQIVCGAPNARAGIKVALALVGAYIPGKDFKIKKSKIRGIESCGMMCSEKEMCISEEHNGIMELPEECKIGMPWFKEYKADEKIPIEVSITPNRGDAASVYGIARDLNACNFGKLRTIEEIKTVKETVKNQHSVEVKIDNCKYFCREIRNINIKAKTPDFILKRNTMNGCSDNGVVVNILNYIMFTYGQPMHSYDSDKIGRNIIVDYAKNDTFLTLKNEQIKFNKNKILMVSDENKDLCIAGIIGGNDCKTTDDTKNILLESAYFPTTQITISGQELNIVSDARFRYERGINPDLTEQMLDIATNMIIKVCGGEVSNIVGAGNLNENKKILYPIELTKKLLGFNIEKDRIINILKLLQFEVKDNGKSLEIIVPRFRHDVEIPADITEEIARINGFQNIPILPCKLSTKFIKNECFNEKIKIKKFLAGYGLIECISMSLCDENKAKLFTVVNPDLRILNPMSNELNYVRPSLLVSLLNVISSNESIILENQLAFFEEGMIFTSPDREGQHNSVAGVYCGNAVQDDHFKEARAFDIYDAKRTLFELLKNIYLINIKNVKILKCEQMYAHPTRSFDVCIRSKDSDNVVIARFGEISPFVLKSFSIKNSVCFFEVFNDLLPLQKKQKQFIENSNLQPIVRDIAFIVNNDITVDKILEAYRDSIIADIKVVDVFKFLSDQKSIALRYTFRPQEPMTIEQINDLMNKIIRAVETKTGGKVRDGK